MKLSKEEKERKYILETLKKKGNLSKEDLDYLYKLSQQENDEYEKFKFERLLEDNEVRWEDIAFLVEKMKREKEKVLWKSEMYDFKKHIESVTGKELTFDELKKGIEM